MGFDADESRKAINRLSKGIEGLPTTLDSVAKTTQRIALMTGDLDGAVDITLALNNAFLASGASSADAARGLEQFVQMLSTGTVDLQSWRTLQETMPVALNKTAEAFGYAGASAQKDLYNALKEG
ncbi:tape measure protein, partial [Pseudomonas aeruginosa]